MLREISSIACVKPALRSSTPINELLRIALIQTGKRNPPEPFVVNARPLGLRPGLSYDNVEDLLDQLDGAFRR